VDQQDVRVWVEPYQFIVDPALRVDETACRSFLEGFVPRQGKVEEPRKFYDQLEDEFSDQFDCGVACNWTLPDTRHMVITITGLGTPNTQPARNPRGLKDEDRRK
jgi:hypothetical protein